MFLLDTNVISAIAPSKEPQIEVLADWLHHASPYLFLSVVTAAVVVSGIAKAERSGAHAKAHLLHDWWEAIEIAMGRGFFSSILRVLMKRERYSMKLVRIVPVSRTLPLLPLRGFMGSPF